MGGGGLRASRSAKEPRTLLKNGGVAASLGPKAGPLRTKLAPVVQAANSWPRGEADADLDRLLECLDSESPADTSAWFADWLLAAPPRARAGLAGQLQRVLRRHLGPMLDDAEEAAAQLGDSAAESCPDVGRLAEACEKVMRLNRSSGVLAATLVLSRVARIDRGTTAVQSPGTSLDFIVPAFDRLARLFHRSFVTHMRSSWTNLQRWREMLTRMEFPPLEEHFLLLGCIARGLLMSMLMVPEGVSQANIVVAREAALADSRAQLPEEHACILSPYFESPAGTKTMHGRRVEGGEGHGPRKEFFVHASAAALRRWSVPLVAPDGDAVLAVGEEGAEEGEGAVCKGQRITLAEPSKRRASSALSEVCKCLDAARAGDRVRLELTDGAQVDRTITGSLSDLVLVVDRCFEGAAASEPISVCRCELEKPIWPLFDFHRATGQQWFAAHANELTGSRGEELRSNYFSFGKLLALAVANHCKLSFVLPTLFFRLLLRPASSGPAFSDSEPPTTLDDLKGFDDVLHASLKKCLKMRQGQFKTLKQVEGLPASCSREDYVRDQLRSILTPAAICEIRRGFASLVREERIPQIEPDDLRHWVCPVSSLSEDINLRHVFNVVMEEEMSECPPLVEAFWATLEALTGAEKRLFLLFVTGVEDPPEAGTEQLIVQLPFSAFTRQEHVVMLGMLPQAHTCTNTLELPNYYEALKESGTVDSDDEAVLATELRRVFGERLRTAISETGGYELDAVQGCNEPDQQSPRAVVANVAAPPESHRGAADGVEGKDPKVSIDVNADPVQRPSIADTDAPAKGVGSPVGESTVVSPAPVTTPSTSTGIVTLEANESTRPSSGRSSTAALSKVPASASCGTVERPPPPEPFFPGDNAVSVEPVTVLREELGGPEGQFCLPLSNKAAVGSPSKVMAASPPKSCGGGPRLPPLSKKPEPPPAGPVPPRASEPVAQGLEASSEADEEGADPSPLPDASTSARELDPGKNTSPRKQAWALDTGDDVEPTAEEEVHGTGSHAMLQSPAEAWALDGGNDMELGAAQETRAPDELTVIDRKGSGKDVDSLLKLLEDFE